MDEYMRCDACRFWRDVNKSYGRCQLHAPKMRGEVLLTKVEEAFAAYNIDAATWPKTEADDFCGEWQAKL